MAISKKAKTPTEATETKASKATKRGRKVKDSETPKIVVKIPKNEFTVAGTVVKTYSAKSYTVVTLITRNGKPNFPRVFCYNECKKFVDALPARSNVIITGRVNTFKEKNEKGTPRQVLTAEKVELSNPLMNTIFGDGYAGKAHLYPNRNDLFLAGEILHVSSLDHINKYLIKVDGERHPSFIQITQYTQKPAPEFNVGDFVNVYCNIQTVRKERDGSFVDFTNFTVLEMHAVKDEAEEDSEE